MLDASQSYHPLVPIALPSESHLWIWRWNIYYAIALSAESHSWTRRCNRLNHFPVPVIASLRPRRLLNPLRGSYNSTGTRKAGKRYGWKQCTLKEGISSLPPLEFSHSLGFPLLMLVIFFLLFHICSLLITIIEVSVFLDPFPSR